MPKLKDLTNKRFGSVTVLSKAESKNGYVYWNCKCDCGNLFTTRAYHLSCGITTSCAPCGRKRQAESIKKHGDYNTKLYAIWTSMRQRCSNPKAQEYQNYGGRGITFCDEWKDYLTFKNWATSNGYKEGLSIERIDVNGNYTPDNCKWIPLGRQGINKRSNRIITFNGVTKCASEMAKDYGLRPSVVHRRLERKWTVERALTEPLHTEMIHS